MLVSEAIVHVNNLGDDQIESDVIISWMNDALAEIGRVVKATFPEITDLNETLPLENKWCRTLIIPFATARMKQQDSSQFEYRDLYSQFMTALDDFSASYVVPDLYKDPVNESYAPDIFTTPPFPWGGKW